MKDLRLKEALNKYCNYCDYCTCRRVVRGHLRKPTNDCKVFKKYLKSLNKYNRYKAKEELHKY